MATKFGRMLAYLEQLPPIRLLIPLVMWSCKVTRQTKTIISPLLQCLWPPNLLGCETYVEELLSYSHMTFNHVLLFRLRDSLKICFSTCTRLMATKLGRVLTTRKRFSMQTLKSSQLLEVRVTRIELINMTCYVLLSDGFKLKHVEYFSSNTKSLTSTLPQCLWSPNLGTPAHKVT